MNELNGKNILIAGGFGLVGWNFRKSLESADVRCNLRLMKCDEFQEVADQKFDIIIHAAGYGQPGKFLQDKLRTISINTTFTASLFRLLKPGGKFLFISTSEIYSGCPSSAETDFGITMPDHPRACYIEGKRCGEAICHAHADMGIDVKIARLALAYGPGTKKGDARVLHSFIERGLQGEIKLMDQGDAMRSYCYISDAIDMMWQILLQGKERIYNIGGKSEVSILELAQMIGEKVGADVIPGFQSMVGAPEMVKLDLSRYEREFGRRAYVSLNEGLNRTIEWQKSL